tara:strand:- start:17 stop:595 length:579 start_codon:yes stop_codon:yes gene_type:complete
MALWGNKDLVTSTGTIAIDVSAKTVTGTGTTFSGHGVSAGDVISVGAGATYGFAVVDTVASNTSLTIHSVQYLVDPHNSESGTDVPSSTAFAISQEPLYAMADTAYAAPEVQTGLSTNPVTRIVYGVDELEVAAANDASGDARKYAPPHSGWVGITTYTDMHGNLRVKHEVLVAGGILTTADADDDTVFPDS